MRSAAAGRQKLAPHGAGSGGMIALWEGAAAGCKASPHRVTMVTMRFIWAGLVSQMAPAGRVNVVLTEMAAMCCVVTQLRGARTFHLWHRGSGSSTCGASSVPARDALAGHTLSIFCRCSRAGAPLSLTG